MYNATDITFTDFHALISILSNGLMDNFTKQMNDETNCMCHRALCHDICKFVKAAEAVAEINTEHTKLATNNSNVVEVLIGEIMKMREINDGNWLDMLLDKWSAPDYVKLFTNELPCRRTKYIVSIDKEKHAIFVLWAQE